jgi:hypothetical protein
VLEERGPFLGERTRPMARILKQSFLLLMVLMAAIQFVRPSRTNPPVDSTREITAMHPAPPGVASTLQRSCNDCHSNRTVWPWYSNVAPASWLVVHDVNAGRSALTFSEADASDIEKRQESARKMCEEVRDREMPMSQYVLLHPRARLTTQEAQALCSWALQIAPGVGVKEDKD